MRFVLDNSVTMRWLFGDGRLAIRHTHNRCWLQLSAVDYLSSRLLCFCRLPLSWEMISDAA